MTAAPATGDHAGVACFSLTITSSYLNDQDVIVHLITSIVVAAMVLLMLWAIFRTLKRRMPRALIPTTLALTAIGYGIYAEYTWESRTLAQLPKAVKVVHSYAGTSAFSPWSYVIPRTDRLSAVDTGTAFRNPEYPELVMLDLYVFQRFQPVITTRQLVDCEGERRSDVAVAQGFNEEGLPDNVQWKPLGGEHALLVASCETR